MLSEALSRLCCGIYGPRSLAYGKSYTKSEDENKAWYQVDHNVYVSKVSDRAIWWQHIGTTLGTLLHHADYSSESQSRHLEFFFRVIAPYLGAALGAQRRWKSFMTDDGNPVEVSWEWAAEDASPKIRYSMEPVGLRAGTLLDSHNRSVGKEFARALFKSLPDINLVWLKHFEREFGCRRRRSISALSGYHSSQRFYAFDLGHDSMVSKAYFFPQYKAREAKEPTLNIISKAMRSAPEWGTSEAQALATFQAFAAEPGMVPLEYDMFAIDLLEPRRSRMKIYFRCRDTDFGSVSNIMTLGGRIRTPAIEQGIEELKRLWDGLFKTDGCSKIALPHVEHRTAGILFNVEFKLESTLPVMKIYLPVRHYCTSDQSIIESLSTYLRSSANGHHVSNYDKAIASLV